MKYRRAVLLTVVAFLAMFSSCSRTQSANPEIGIYIGSMHGGDLMAGMTIYGFCDNYGNLIYAGHSGHLISLPQGCVSPVPKK